MATKVKTGVIDSGAITSALITDASITADDLHTTLDLTGKTVTVSTASAGDNDTSVASTAYVDVAIANLTDSAPSTLDTLNELAAALGDDANFSTTVTNSIATKSPINNPEFTGTVKAAQSGNFNIPTASSGNADISFDGSNFTIVSNSSSANLKLQTNSQDAVTIAANGNTTFAGTISSGAISTTGSANAVSAAHLPALLASGSYGGGIATRDTQESGWYQQTNGADWHFYHNRTIASDTPDSKKVLSFNSTGAASFANTITIGTDPGGDAFNTTSPLMIGSTTNAYINIKAGTGHAGGLLVGDSDDDFVGGFIYSNSTNDLTLYANNNECMNIKSTGQIHIGYDSIGGSAGTSGVILSDGRKNGSLGTTLGDTQRVVQFHNLSHNADFLTFRTRRITAGQTGWNHAVWDITRDIDNTSDLYRYMTFGIGDLVINEFGDNLDFRVETDSYSHALFVDASSNNIIFGRETHSWTANNFHIASPVNGGIAVTANGDWGLQMAGTRAERIRFFSSAGGSTTVGNVSVDTTGTTYSTTSDRRLKENIQTLTDATDKLIAMNPVEHTWKADPESDAVHGFIAQEMMDIVPEAVTGDPEGEEMMSMDYGRITPIIVAALQDALKEIKELKTRINELEGK